MERGQRLFNGWLVLLLLMGVMMMVLAGAAEVAQAGDNAAEVAQVEDTQFHTTEPDRGVKNVQGAIRAGATQFIFVSWEVPGERYNKLPGVREPMYVPEWETVTVYSLYLPDGTERK